MIVKLWDASEGRGNLNEDTGIKVVGKCCIIYWLAFDDIGICVEYFGEYWESIS